MSSDDLSEDTNGGPDGEGVWSPDIEQSFQEALLMYPPCGRRKIIINDDAGGKMYGRNELIARYIKVRTGKTRSRKQVSSHIQVLARRKAKEATTRVSSTHTPSHNNSNANNNIINNQNSNNSNNGTTNHSNNANNGNTRLMLHSYDEISNNSIINTSNNNNQTNHHHHHHHHTPHHPFFHQNQNNFLNNLNNNTATAATTLMSNNIINHDEMLRISSISSQKLRLVEFSAFMNPHQRNQNDNGNSIVLYPAHNNHNGHQNNSHHHNHHHNHHHHYHHQSSSPLPSSHQHSQIANEHNNDNHFFVHINQRTQTIQNETIDIAQILDKFPNEKGGLKDLYDQGPKDAFFLVKCWGDLNEHELDEQNSFYGFSSHFESNEDMTIFCSTKVCSFGKVAAELDDKQKAVCKNGRYSYYFHPQPMCNYMVEFIRKLRDLPHIDLMNSVLENFTILKVVKDHATKETLLCIAFIFEVSQKNGATHNIYKLKGV